MAIELKTISKLLITETRRTGEVQTIYSMSVQHYDTLELKV